MRGLASKRAPSNQRQHDCVDDAQMVSLLGLFLPWGLVGTGIEGPGTKQ